MARFVVSGQVDGICDRDSCFIGLNLGELIIYGRTWSELMTDPDLMCQPRYSQRLLPTVPRSEHRFFVLTSPGHSRSQRTTFRRITACIMARTYRFQPSRPS
jgi:hypothetical protein